VNIAGREIGPGHPPYIVAEIAGEHLGDEWTLLRLLNAAHHAGADAVKLQCYDPAKLAEARGGAGKVLSDGLWKGRSLGDLYAAAHTPRSLVARAFDYCRNSGITVFSSVFDEEGVDYLESLGCPALKIASFELTDLALIRKAASTGKPVIISTGMGSEAEVWQASWEAQEAARHESAPAILHCVSSYPCRVSDLNLRDRFDEMNRHYSVIGLSDHTLGSVAPVVATALGASIIEKHITLDRKNGGPDAPFSLEPAEFAKMVQDVKDAYASLGTGGRPKSEEIYRELRRTSV
jgi:sialic acid synthase SpsE